MALAILKFVQRADGKYIFEADIGTNNWYEYRIGKSRRKHRGVEFLDEVAYQSDLRQVLSGSRTPFQTQFLLDIDATAIDRNNRLVQLFSYKDRNKASPAISEIVTVVPSIADLDDNFKLPTMMTTQQEIYQMSTMEVRNAPFRIKDNRVSEAFFFNAILGALPGLLNNALPMIGKILPGLQKAAPVIGDIAGKAGAILPELMKIIPQDVKPGAEGAQQVLQNIDPETIKAILQVLQGQMAQQPTPTPNGSTAQSLKANGSAKDFRNQKTHRFSHDFAINPAMLMQLAPLLEKVLSPETIKAIGDNPVKLFKAISDSALKFQKMELEHLEKINPGVDDAGFDKIVAGMSRSKSIHQKTRRRNGRFSEAKVAPALLAALPALLPLIEKVLSPDMIKAIGEQPVKLFNAISEAGLKHTKQELEHLEKINPGVDDPAFDNIVNSMSVKSAITIQATFSDDYTIKFLDAVPIPVAGKEKVVYDRRQKITLPIQLNAGKDKTKGNTSVARGIFQLIIQDPDNMEVLFEKKIKVKDVVIGAPVAHIILTSDEVRSLPPNQDLKVELTFNWKDGKRTLGTFMNHYITLTDGFIYQRVGGDALQHFALNDVARFRNYWHKVWEGGPTSHERWKVDFECKYYYHLNDEDATIKKLETRKKKVSDSADSNGEDYRRKIHARLKSGMEISVEAHNELLRLHNLPPLNPEQLHAFRSDEFEKESGLVARLSVDFRGRRGETAALWTYPEGHFQSYVLSKVTSSDASGLVTKTEEEQVHFPKFTSVHFIGTQSI